MRVPYYLASTLNSINYAMTAPQKHRAEVYDSINAAHVTELTAFGFIVPLGGGRGFALTPQGSASLSDHNRTRAWIDDAEAQEERRTGWGIY